MLIVISKETPTGIDDKTLSSTIDDLISYVDKAPVATSVPTEQATKQPREAAAERLVGVDPDKKLMELLAKPEVRNKLKMVGTTISQAKDIIINETLSDIGVSKPSDADRLFVEHFYGGFLNDAGWWDTIYDIVLDPEGEDKSLPNPADMISVRKQIEEEHKADLPGPERGQDMWSARTDLGYIGAGEPGSIEAL